MIRKIEFSPAYDKRSPDPCKDYGVGDAKIRFIVSDDRGAVQFLMATGWYLPEVAAGFRDSVKGILCQMRAYDLGYHSPTPRWEGQSAMQDSCEYLGGKPCYYDGSTLNAERLLPTLLTEGDAGIWRELEQYHAEIFGAVAE